MQTPPVEVSKWNIAQKHTKVMLQSHKEMQKTISKVTLNDLK